MFYKKTDFPFENKEVSILEIGFGTGLNAFITFFGRTKMNQSIRWVEAYPISAEELMSMNYVEELNAGWEGEFRKIHQYNWEENDAWVINFH
jgi:tRNA U34 5-methylaminomethyl-2-thiouridine-forming methyltransferase MnmC